jgi:DNA polymerase-3 subunit chi
VSRVDFYVLSDASPDARLRVTCRLAEKAYDQGKRVYVQTPTRAEAQRLDDMLWTFNERSFIPHEVVADAPPSHAKVMILLGEAAAPPSHRDLLINLTNVLPAALETFQRIVEVVDVDEERKRLSRERFKAYRERGCQMETHNL